MNGHERRRQRLIERIKKSALALFKQRGTAEVRIDEIAASANVSKVTIYKYFHTKDNLVREVISLYLEELMEAAETVLDSDLDVAEKLKITMLAKATAPQLADSQALFNLLDADQPAGPEGRGSLASRVRDLLFRIYEDARKEGQLEEGLSFEMLNLYSDIFLAGFKAKSQELQTVLADPQAFQQLMALFFYGFIRRK